ncbi:MAG: TM2 domain-containing protein [Clostridiales bacterium]|jgi:hypothetical protein|nr:TM2 domain-containing protein [Clostridiales bacterium]
MAAYRQCEYCGTRSPSDATVCPHCNAQLNGKVFTDNTDIKETLSLAVGSVLQKINDGINGARDKASAPGERSAAPQKRAANGKRTVNKYIALLLFIFLWFVAAHKFYEGKTVRGVLYLFTFGLFFVGYIVDFFALLQKPREYPAAR